jgi:hypothetical protein
MALFQKDNNPHFVDPWVFMPYTPLATSLEVQDSGAVQQDSSTVAFFTEMARRGIQDTTNWTADTYKTLLNVTSGYGVVAAIVGPTAGGSSTTTFEITRDGHVTEIAVPGLSSGERAYLTAFSPYAGDMFTAANNSQFPGGEALDSNKQVFGAPISATSNVPPWWLTSVMGTPMLRFNYSLLIRAKHSASITNSTATAYSAVMYRLGL